MKIHKNIVVTGSLGKPMLTDVFYQESEEKRPVVIYAHGFNGFKDWGNFDLIAQQFAEAGFVFIKFNFSHNGTTANAPEEFDDLEAFAENNYTKEIADLENVIDWVCDAKSFFSPQVDIDRIFLVGHSMGGGICLLTSSTDKRVKALATWASIGECKTPWGKWPDEKIEEWRKEGVTFITNGRTKQEMPLNFQLYEDYWLNKEKLDIKKTAKELKIPVLICHGINDEAVPVETAYELNQLLPESKLLVVESDHVFGRKHPWTSDTLPAAMQKVVNETIDFFTAK